MIFALTAVVLGGAYVNVLNSYEVAPALERERRRRDLRALAAPAQSDLPTAQAGAEFDDGDRHVKWTAEIDPSDTTDLFTVTFTCVITDPAGSGTRRRSSRTSCSCARRGRTRRRAPTLRQAAADRIAKFQGKVAK
jgi:hypothetical protein